MDSIQHEHDRLWSVIKAARSNSPVSGLTHRFYRYPARFSPQFVSQTISALSNPGDLVLDPFMGGGTTVVEAMVGGRRAVGCDVSELAVFVARVKTTSLTARERVAVAEWVICIAEGVRYSNALDLELDVTDPRVRNMSIPRARPIKKMLALCLESLGALPNRRTRDFGRCLLLNVGQWALNGKRQTPSLKEFRTKIAEVSGEMLFAVEEFMEASRQVPTATSRPVLINAPCELLPAHELFGGGEKVDLVLTSPPYPGVHVLYHRWQVDGRKETPAPFWIADCTDGEGPGFYNLATRGATRQDVYFEELQRSMTAIRRVCRDGAHMVQLVAFARPRFQLKRYLAVMEQCGFREVGHITATARSTRRVSRDVPQRAWHANSLGRTSASKEILLIHQAI